jgi:hypothetical protein
MVAKADRQFGQSGAAVKVTVRDLASSSNAAKVTWSMNQSR